jgi:chromosome segregation ATPase
MNSKLTLEQALKEIESLKEEVESLEEEIYHLNDDFIDAKRRILFLESRGVVTVTKKVEVIRDLTIAEKQILSLTKARRARRENLKKHKEEDKKNKVSSKKKS